MSQSSRKRRSFLVLVAIVAALPLAGSASPAVAAPAPSCTGLHKLLRLWPTPAPTPTPTPTPSPTPTGTACGGITTLPKAGGGVWTCAFGDEFSGTTLDRSMWLPQPTKGTGFDSNDHDCFMDSPNNVSVG